MELIKGIKPGSWIVTIYGVAGSGKALRHDMPVLTPTGWTPISSIRIGDEVMTPNGNRTKVTGVFPQGKKKLFEIKTTLGASVICCDDHLWLTSERSKGHRFETVVTTNHIRKTLKCGGKRYEINHRLPLLNAMEFGHGDPEVDPYLLGVWIGDGSVKTTMITNPEDSILDEIKKRSPTATRRKDSLVINLSNLQLRAFLEANFLFDKNSHARFIPRSCLLASTSFRLALIQGLFDTDGYASEHGHSASFSTSSKQLADDLQFLIASLGGYGSRSLKENCGYKDANGNFVHCKDSHVVSFSAPDEFNFPFLASSNKANRYGKPDNMDRYRRHYISEVNEVESDEAICIAVADESHMYVTKDFLPTHNSTMATYAPDPVFLDCENGLDRIDCTSTPVVKNTAQLREYLRELYRSPHKTIVIDTLSAVEEMLIRDILDENPKCESLADFGYGAGFELLRQRWIGFAKILFDIKASGKNVLCIAHDVVEKVENPSGDNYDRHSMAVHKKAQPVITAKMDAVLFAHYEKVYKSKEKGSEKKVALDTGKRMVRTIERPFCLAKNRFGLQELMDYSTPELAKALFDAMR